MKVFGMTLRWPWDHSAVDAHNEYVDEQEAHVRAIHKEAMKQKAENNIGALLTDLFTLPPKEHR